jgi:FMN phosphatase YigB (HAD superfamily)
MVFPDWQTAIAVAQKAVHEGKVEVIFSDVFDTLLLRRTGAESIIESIVQDVANLTSVDLDTCLLARQQAWKNLTFEATRLGKDPDTTASELWSEWIRLLGIKDNTSYLVTRLEEIEIQRETYALKLNATVFDWLISNARDRRVVLVSDMYLEPNHIRRIFTNHGVDTSKFEIVTSGAVGLQKRTGRLFKYLAQELGLDPTRTLHIGDCEIADGEKAVENGLKSVVVKDHRTKTLRKNSQIMSRLAHQGEKLARCLEAEASAIVTGAPENVAVTEVGRVSLGTVYAGFIWRLAEEIVQDGYDQVWFMAREGALLRHLYEMRRDVGDETGQRLPPSGYLPISRQSSIKATIGVFGEREYDAIFMNSGCVTAKRWLSLLDIDDTQISLIAQDVGLSDDAQPIEKGDAAYRNIISDPRVIEASVTAREENFNGLLSLLTNHGFAFGGKVAVVDLGWGAQIQEHFSKFLGSIETPTRLTGFYLGTNETAYGRIQKGMDIRSVIAQSYGTKQGKGIFNFVVGFELIARAAHGSIKGYTLDGSAVTDSAKGRKLEENDDSKIAAAQRGIIQYSKEFFQVALALNLQSADIKRLARFRAESLALLPNKYFADMMMSMTNIANMGSSDALTMGQRIKLSKIRAARDQIRNSYWKEGTLASSLSEIAPVFLMAFYRTRGVTWLLKNNLIKGLGGTCISNSDREDGGTPAAVVSKAKVGESKDLPAECDLYVEAEKFMLTSPFADNSTPQPFTLRGNFSRVLWNDLALAAYFGRTTTFSINAWIKTGCSIWLHTHWSRIKNCRWRSVK